MRWMVLQIKIRISHLNHIIEFQQPQQNERPVNCGFVFNRRHCMSAEAIAAAARARFSRARVRLKRA